MRFLDRIRGNEPAPGDSLAVAVETATKAFLTAQASLREADAAWLEALADEQLGKGTGAEVAAAEKDLGTAQNAFAKAEAALNAVKHRQNLEDQKRRDAEERAAAKAQAEPWNRAIALGEKRFEVMEALDKAAVALANAYQEAKRSNIEFASSLPAKPDPDAVRIYGSGAGEAALEAALRFRLHQLGMKWSGSAGWTDPFRPPPEFLQPYRDTPGLVKKWRTQALGRG